MERLLPWILLAFAALTAGCAGQKPSPAPTGDEAIRAAIEDHWNPPVGMSNIAAYVVRLRLHMKPDGTVQSMELIDPQNSDQGYRILAESAERAVELTILDEGRLPMPSSGYHQTMVLVWDMKNVCQDMGGC